MKRGDISPAGRCHRALVLTLLCGGFALDPSRLLARGILQGEVDVSPEATPEVRQVRPDQAAAGAEVVVAIEGNNFSRGAYVSFSNPMVQVVSTRRVSATELQTKLAIAKKAQPGTVSLYVSNPAGAVAEVPFSIVEETPQLAASPAPPAPPAPAEEIQPSGFATPEVTALAPARAEVGSQVSVKVTGKNFDKQAKVSSSSPGIRVLETKVKKPTELTARLQVAPDAPAGPTSLYVVNPDGRGAEAVLELASGGETKAAPPAAQPGAESAAAPQRFEVYNLGDVVSILQSPNKPKGTLSLAAGKLRFEEGGQEVFSVTVADVKEIEPNVILGVNTGTFHIVVKSGQTYNFVAATLRPADNQMIVDSLRRALR